MNYQQRFYIHKKCINLVRLMRINQPIGFFLLLWPTLWSLWFANQGIPANKFIITLFVIGVICMRSAGCVINDYIDYQIDSHVTRTKNRPLINGTVKKQEALIIFLVLIFIAMILVLTFNIITIFLSLIALILTIIYPFLKRYTYLPQIVLGIIFSFPIVITYTATHYPINSTTWLLFITNTIWTILYDTQYAMMDSHDDQKISIKSSALLFGNHDKFIIGILQLVTILLLMIIAWKEQLSISFYLFSILGPSILFIYQQFLIHNRSQKGCYKAFSNNNYVGFLIFIGIVLHFY